MRRFFRHTALRVARFAGIWRCTTKSWRARRLEQLPPYLFVEIDRKKRQAMADPDRPTPSFLLDCMAGAIRESRYHRYAPTVGYPEFRDAVSTYMQRRFGVRVDSSREVLSLIGSKEGLGHLPLALINPGDAVLIPRPGYPVYESGTVFAGGTVVDMPLREDREWLPTLDEFSREERSRIRLMFLNYPNNPTAASAGLAFFEAAIRLAREHGILIVHDAAYSEVYFDDPPPSILQVEGAAETAIELHSLSKTFNMTGWRIGFAVGNSEVLSALAAVKSNVDSGIFGAIQQVGVMALNHFDHPDVHAQREIYRRRRDALVEGLRRAGWRVPVPGATFFVWLPCPAGLDSMTVAGRILDQADVVAVPGVGFGPQGERYLRFSLTVDEARIREACERIARIRWI
jgi:LL-diaminopimelate aminotransferase